MTLENKSLTGASLTKNLEWKSTDWKTAEKTVFRLQMRIAKAMREKKYNKVKTLQRILTRSYSAKLLAVRKVTSNKGSKTPGIDGITWKTDNQKAKAVAVLRHKGYKPMPVKRIYITKSNGKKRPLGILTMVDRAMQAISLFALEPVAETIADPNSYGFRPHRNCADAITQVHIALARKISAKWILECDIKSCFDEIDHSWLENNILMEKTLLKKWLKAGYMNKNTIHYTESGTPQGSIISPCLTLMTLSGLEKAIKLKSKSSDKINVITYADDFVVTGSSKELLENHVKPRIVSFLNERGLTLSEKKTKVTHIDNGFDFLGFNVRKYNGKILIKPAKKNVKNFLSEIRYTIKSNRAAKTENLIRLLNPKIIGWTNYYSNVASKKTFNVVDHRIYESLFNWCKRRHPNKGLRWIKKKYFYSKGLRNWVFSSRVTNDKQQKDSVELFSALSVKIRRHIKTRYNATPYDPEFLEYFSNRIHKKRYGGQAKSTNIARPKHEFLCGNIQISV